LLELKNIFKRYGELQAVDDVSLHIRKNEFFCLLGPSGSGKTTMLRMIAGFETPDSGTVLLNGSDITATPPHRRNVNTVFQNYALFPHLSVFDNIAYGLRIRKSPDDLIRKKVMNILDLFGLPDKHASFPGQLSGGQAQRVALARALVNEPDVLLLDEPLAALDEKLRDRMQVELANIQRNVRTTFILVTHNQEEALTMGDRIAVMNEGRIEQLGPPEDIYSQPESRFVAEFIGTSNLLDGEIIERSDSELTLRLPTGSEIIKTPKRPIPDNLSSLLLSIRPEQLRIWKEQPADSDDNIFRGRILNEVFYGDYSIFIVELDMGVKVSVQFLNYLPSGDNPQSFREGEEIWVGWNKMAGHLLW